MFLKFSIILTFFYLINCDNNLNINNDDDKKFYQTTINIIREKIIPEQLKRIKQSIQPECLKAMDKKFNNCEKNFIDKLNEFNINNNNDKNYTNLITIGSKYEHRWPLCCIIYDYNQCLKQSIELNSHYTTMLCDENDVLITETLIKSIDQHELTNGYCPNDHIEYQICNMDIVNFFGHNIFTKIVLILGAIAISIAMIFSTYIVITMREENYRERRMAKFQILQPIEFETISSNQL